MVSVHSCGSECGQKVFKTASSYTVKTAGGNITAFLIRSEQAKLLCLKMRRDKVNTTENKINHLITSGENTEEAPFKSKLVDILQSEHSVPLTDVLKARGGLRKQSKVRSLGAGGSWAGP